MDIPIISASINGNTYRIFFDSAAQISYFQDGSLETYPEAGILRDFYTGFGQFETETYSLETTLGNYAIFFHYGSLPSLLGMTLMLANTQNIIGNDIIKDETTLFAPRLKKLISQIRR